MTDNLSWQLVDEGTLTRVELSGSVNEDSDLETLSSELSGRNSIAFKMQGVERINSCGVREWVNFLRSFSQETSLELSSCSPAVVAQLNMIDNFAGNAKVTSVFAPYACDDCGHEENIALEVSSGDIPEMEDLNCPECKGSMEFDDLVESYFAFISGQ